MTYKVIYHLRRESVETLLVIEAGNLGMSRNMTAVVNHTTTHSRAVLSRAVLDSIDQLLIIVTYDTITLSGQ
jgi:hypothetical protein